MQISLPQRSVLAIALALASAMAAAQQPGSSRDATDLDRIEVLGEARPLSRFPGAVSVIGGDTLRDGQRQVDLAENLSRVPGMTVRDRQNYAQDLQVQSRGFGARSTFGIRGIKLVVDGIPSSAADGQGQAANFPLDTLDRIEVLRGPLALQYGNAAGGAIVGYTDLDGGRDLALQAWTGSDDSHRVSVRSDGASPGDTLRWRLQGSRFDTDGARAHSAATRSQFTAVSEWRPGERSRLRLALNALSQPDTQDPLGLTREQWQRDPHGSDAAAIGFNTRKTIENHQAGLRWDLDHAPGRAAWISGYRIHRDVTQFLAIPKGPQAAPGSAGGVIDLGRRSSGIDAGHRWSGERGAIALGLELARLDEARRGYENFVGDTVGIRGRLRRDEHNRVDSRNVYLIGDFEPAADWTLLAAVRRSSLVFVSDDHFVAPGNGDDSGRLDFNEHAVSFGVARALAYGELFASIGRGFETPTNNELAYRPDGSAGFNAGLSPARFGTAEVGARWRFPAGDASVAVYRVEGDREIVPAESRGGRSSFANAAGTRRDGIEASLSGDFGRHWSYALAANWIRARFEQDFSYRVVRGVDVEVRTVAAGNRIPGIPRADAFAELAWHGWDRRLAAAIEARFSDRTFTDDLNSDAAPGHARFALRAAWRPRHERGWHGFARIDNLLDRDYVGSVIVNDGNGRFFEPGAGRAMTLGIGWKMQR